MTQVVPCFNNGLSSKCTEEEQELIRKTVQDLYDGGETEVKSSWTSLVKYDLTQCLLYFQFLKKMPCQIPCKVPTYKVMKQSTFEQVENDQNSTVKLVFYAPKPK